MEIQRIKIINESKPKLKRMLCVDCNKEICRSSWSTHQRSTNHQFNSNFEEPKPLDREGKKETYCKKCDRWMTKSGLRYHNDHNCHMHV